MHGILHSITINRCKDKSIGHQSFRPRMDWGGEAFLPVVEETDKL